MDTTVSEPVSNDALPAFVRNPKNFCTAVLLTISVSATYLRNSRTAFLLSSNFPRPSLWRASQQFNLVKFLTNLDVRVSVSPTNSERCAAFPKLFFESLLSTIPGGECFKLSTVPTVSWNMEYQRKNNFENPESLKSLQLFLKCSGYHRNAGGCFRSPFKHW